MLSILQSLLWILKVKRALMKNIYCPKFVTNLKIIPNKNPWIKANEILSILQTGKLNKLKSLVRSKSKSKLGSNLIQKIDEIKRISNNYRTSEYLVWKKFSLHFVDHQLQLLHETR